MRMLLPPVWILLTTLALSPGFDLRAATFPGRDWETRTPAEVGLDVTKLDAIRDYLRGRGCIVRHGYLVYSWGNITNRGDVASAAKPWYATFLFKAVEDGRLPSLDTPVVKYEPRLSALNASLGHKDENITFRHMANQISCYGVQEAPGTAFDYNDWQMALFWDTLFLKVYGATYSNVDDTVLHPMLTSILQCQDNPTFMAFGTGDRPGRLAVSPRDFARFGLLYLHRGNWNGTQVISEAHARMAVSSPLPLSIPRTTGVAAQMIPRQRSIGSLKIPDNQTDDDGSYSWLWWINGVQRNGARRWPDAPADVFTCRGHRNGLRGIAVMPSQGIVISWNDTRLGNYPSNPDPLNPVFRDIMQAITNGPLTGQIIISQPDKSSSSAVGQPTSDPVRDLYADTWVATDALGRPLPGYQQCGPPRTNRTVALFYFIWHGQHGTDGPYDITKLLAANPTHPAWGPKGHFHHWGEPELGYYLSDDEYVIRRHAHLLADAGVDVIVFDVTNGLTYTNNYMTLCRIYMQIRAEGGTTPQICFMANSDGDNVVRTLYRDLYSKNLFRQLWFYFKGKPLLLAPMDGHLSRQIRDFFTMRYCWTWMKAGRDRWKWMDFYPQQYAWHESPDRPEEMSVSVGIVPHGKGIGRSFHNGAEPPHNQYGLTGTEALGLCFAEQWSRVKEVDPELLFITGWNEWVAQRQVFRGSGDPATMFLGKKMVPGDTWFIDTYNQEFSRDIEPMKGGHTDDYYYQMIAGIRRYKGVRKPPRPSAPKAIAMDGRFADWDDVGPEYRDWLNDTTHRNHKGWGAAGIYTNTTGRNDFIAAKVARDDQYIYFYIETAQDITPWTDPNWMLLFINADQDYTTGWEGYDYAVNLSVNSDASTTLKTTRHGWHWTNVDAHIPYRVSGRKLELRIPRREIGQGSGEAPVAFDFHWADNIQAKDDIIQFAVSGDSAPDRRFNYRYQTK